MSEFTLARMNLADIDSLTEAFSSWPKPRATFTSYWQEQLEGRREVLIARFAKEKALPGEKEICGYGTLIWNSPDDYYAGQQIPEISDLNVLQAFRRRGVASALLDALESHAARQSSSVALGVGLYSDYGAAQRIYFKRGYVPDGRCLLKHGRQVAAGEVIAIDDEPELKFVKNLTIN